MFLNRIIWPSYPITEQLRSGIEFFTQYLLINIIDCQSSVASMTKEDFDKYNEIFLLDKIFEIAVILFFVLIVLSLSLATSTLFIPRSFLLNNMLLIYN